MSSHFCKTLTGPFLLRLLLHATWFARWKAVF
jgi:hypothetical protein